jgi:hypothetical protein
MKCYQHLLVEEGLERFESLTIKSLKNFMGTPHHPKNLMANFGNVGTKHKIGKY